MIQLTDLPIEPSLLLAAVASDDAGANLLFVGTTRQFTSDKQTTRLEYQAYSQMAEKQMQRLAAEAAEQWPIIRCALVHRIGRVEIGQPSVAVAVSAVHRDAAFQAGRWLIDQLKAVVPIWKQENWADGTSEWVHGG